MLTGKGMFIWKIQSCHKGDISEILRKAVKANYSHVLIKIANGIYSYNYDWEKQIDLVPPLVAALKSEGILGLALSLWRSTGTRSSESYQPYPRIRRGWICT